MKKSVFLALAIGLTLGAAAQAPLNNVQNVRPGFKMDRNIMPALNHTAAQNKSAAQFNEWIDYQVAYETFWGATSSLYANQLFPDSTGLVNYSTGPGAAWIHNVAQVFDLSSSVLNANYTSSFDANAGYTIDSIQAVVLYNRVNMSASQFDTLIVRVTTPSAANLDAFFQFGSTSGVSANLNPGGSVVFPNMQWNYNSTSVPGTVATYKIPMGDAFFADSTSTGLHVASIAANLPVPVATINNAQGVFAINLEFKPGYTWTPNVDTLDYSINSLRFLSWELNGDDTYPFYSAGDFQVAYIVPIDVRYNYAGSWNDSFIPSYAYMGSSPSYSYEDHAIYAKISQTNNIGVEDAAGIQFNVFPNPTTGTVNVRFAEAGTYTMNLVNILGQVVLTESVNVQAGEVITRNVSNLDKGIYMLNVNNGQNSRVEKITLQ